MIQFDNVRRQYYCECRYSFADVTALYVTVTQRGLIYVECPKCKADLQIGWDN